MQASVHFHFKCLIGNRNGNCIGRSFSNLTRFRAPAVIRYSLIMRSFADACSPGEGALVRQAQSAQNFNDCHIAPAIIIRLRRLTYHRCEPHWRFQRARSTRAARQGGTRPEFTRRGRRRAGEINAALPPSFRIVCSSQGSSFLPSSYGELDPPGAMNVER
jgi:hypothetical protein